MAKAKTYEGAVCYLDGWHWSVVEAADGSTEPGERLFLDDDGTYRLAAADDLSWHERKHQGFASVVMEDGAQQTRVTAEEFAAVQQMLEERRGR